MANVPNQRDLRASQASGMAAATAAVAARPPIASDQKHSRRHCHGARTMVHKHLAADQFRTRPASVCETKTPAL